MILVFVKKYQMNNKTSKWGRQILIDDKIEREGFLNGDERVSF